LIQFFAPGIPAQQGSKTPVGSGRFVESNPQLKSWRSVVAASCVRSHPAVEPLTGPVFMTLVFWYPRPQGHYRKRKGEVMLRDDAPTYKQSAPDLDKLVRAVCDALTGIAFADDKLVANLLAVKRYTEKTAGVEITISSLPQP
jgi:crossover junction endodeoxyribonuclease RusA